MDTTKNVTSVEIEKISRENVNDIQVKTDTVLKEYELNMIINNTIKRKFICTNTSIKQLVYGHLFTQNYIESASDILEFNYDEGKSSVYVIITEEAFNKCKDRIDKVDILTTGFLYNDGSNKNFDDNKKDEVKINNFIAIMDNSKKILEGNDLFTETGCVHSAGLAFGDDIKYFETDIGRHNAVDKTIGRALIAGDNLKDAILYTTGRIPTDMIKKAVRAGIRIVATRASVTYDAIKIAKENGIKLIGFSRGERVNIYS